MALISQPGSDYQIVSISLDAGYTRDLILMPIDVHAVLDHLYLDGTQPQITSPAEDYLRESASPYTLPALIDALGEVTDQLSRAESQALDSIPPGTPARVGHPGPAGRCVQPAEHARRRLPRARRMAGRQARLTCRLTAPVHRQGFAKAIKDIPGGSRGAMGSTGTCPGHSDDRLPGPRERRSSS